MKSLVIAALAAALPLVSANAEIITVEYEGDVGGIFLPEGVVFVGSFTFDSEATPVIVGETATYPLLDHRMTLDGVSFIGDTGQSILFVANDAERPLEFDFEDLYVILSPTTGAYEGVQIDEFGFAMQSTFDAIPGGPLASLALPLTEDELAAFNLKVVFLSFGEGSISVPLTRLEFLTPPLSAACDGFDAPFDAALGLGKKEQRVIPLRLTLLDEDDFPLGPDDITAPTVSVGYASGIGGGVLDLLLLVDSAGKATSGNSFVWDEASQQWAFNLSTKPHAALGTYTVTAVAGYEDYVLSQACSGTFVRQ